MHKIEETFVTVKGTFAIYESRARNFILYETAEMFWRMDIDKTKIISSS